MFLFYFPHFAFLDSVCVYRRYCALETVILQSSSVSNDKALTGLLTNKKEDGSSAGDTSGTPDADAGLEDKLRLLAIALLEGGESLKQEARKSLEDAVRTAAEKSSGGGGGGAPVDGSSMHEPSLVDGVLKFLKMHANALSASSELSAGTGGGSGGAGDAKASRFSWASGLVSNVVKSVKQTYVHSATVN